MATVVSERNRTEILGLRRVKALMRCRWCKTVVGPEDLRSTGRAEFNSETGKYQHELQHRECGRLLWLNPGRYRAMFEPDVPLHRRPRRV